MCLTPDPRTGGHERSRRCILLPHHRKFLKCAFGAKHISIGFFPSWQYRCRHPVEAGIQRRLGWMLWYKRGRGFVCTPSNPITLLLGFLERVRRDGVLLLLNPILVRPSIVLWPDFSPRRLSMGDSRQEGSPLTGSRNYLSPPLGVVEAVGVAPEGAQLIASGLSTEVAETILQSRAPSMRKLYALKLRLRVRKPPAWSS